MADPLPSGEDKSTRFTLTVTVCLMTVLIIAAWALKRNAPENDRGGAAGTPGTEPVKSAVSGPVPPSIPRGDDGNPKSDYEILTNCRLEDDPANDGDTFRVATPRGSHLFRLYWVQTVQMNGGTPATIREAMDHFGLKTEAQVRDLATQAKDFSLNLIRNVHFRVITRWEKDPADGAWLCFVYVSDEGTPQPALQNLALMLVQNGLALIRPCQWPLPEVGTTAGDFQNQLTTAEDEARRSLTGGWAGRGG